MEGQLIFHTGLGRVCSDARLGRITPVVFRGSTIYSGPTSARGSDRLVYFYVCEGFSGMSSVKYARFNTHDIASSVAVMV